MLASVMMATPSRYIYQERYHVWVTQHLQRTIPCPCAMILYFNCAETKMTLHLIYSLIPIGCSALLRPGKVSCYTLLMATLMDTFSCHILHLNPGLLTGLLLVSPPHHCPLHHLGFVTTGAPPIQPQQFLGAEFGFSDCYDFANFDFN